MRLSIKAKVSTLSKDLLGYKLGDKKIKVKLKFSKIEKYLFETPLSNKQKISETKDGFFMVEDDVTDNMELRYWIRSLEMKVIQPKSLREEFSKTLNAP